MTQKTFLLIASMIFLLIALAHLSRLVFKWSVLLGGWAVPFWVNWVALLVFAYLAYEGFRLGKKSP
jgi:phosphoglycerol transferase MdoB-like AlkP superfamily enzyme